MARTIIILFCFIFYGCEINSSQIIRAEKFSYDTIYFDTVSKELFNEIDINISDNKKITEIIRYWFDNRIKTNGFDGTLIVNIKKIEFSREKKSDFYKFSVNLSIEFIEQLNLNKKRVFNVNSNEYGEIKGSFSIKDQENLDLNLMHKSLENISIKLKDIN